MIRNHLKSYYFLVITGNRKIQNFILMSTDNLSSLYETTSNEYTTEYIPTYKPGNCPDTLTWSKETEMCEIRCYLPVYSDAESDAVFYIAIIFGIIGFLLCYFYCITSLFRPIMLKFPNSNIFYMHLTGAFFYIAIFIPWFLGRRYVFCNTNIIIADQSNWACTIEGNFLI